MKRQDLDYGFTQLMADMVALDQWDQPPNNPRYWVTRIILRNSFPGRT